MPLEEIAKIARMTMSKLVFAAMMLPVFARGGVFQGESCQRCHTGIRDAAPRRRLSVPAKEDLHDVIVVGGGVAGLTAAYKLKDLDVLVLEKEDAAGGKVRRELWGHARYPVAAGYMSQVYLKDIADIFGALDIKGDVIPEPGNSLFSGPGKGIVDDPFGKGLEKLSEPDDVKAALKRLKADMDAMGKGGDVGQVPPVPAPEQMNEVQRALDKQSFWDYMDGKYGRRVAEFSDRYSKSLFGVEARKVSAWTGLVYFSADFGDGANITWDGGPGVISEKLAQALAGSVRLGALVTAVIPDETGVTVEYELRGKRARARAKSVVVAVPSFVAKRIVVGLPRWKKDALASTRYSAYAVAIVALDKSLYHQSFDLWSDSTTVFTDLEPLDWGRTPETGPGTPAQILEAFVPLGEDDGRHVFLKTPDEKIAAKVKAGLERIFPEAKSALHGIRVIRWGHAMPIDYPGYLSDKRPNVMKAVGRLSFAGVDTEMPCIEGAMVSGVRAASEARASASR